MLDYLWFMRFIFSLQVLMRDIGQACRANNPAQGMALYRQAKAAGTKIIPSVYNTLIALCR